MVAYFTTKRIGCRTIGLRDDALASMVLASFGNDADGERLFALLKEGIARNGADTLLDADTGKMLVGTVGELDKPE